MEGDAGHVVGAGVEHQSCVWLCSKVYRLMQCDNVIIAQIPVRGGEGGELDVQSVIFVVIPTLNQTSTTEEAVRNVLIRII